MSVKPRDSKNSQKAGKTVMEAEKDRVNAVVDMKTLKAEYLKLFESATKDKEKINELNELIKEKDADLASANTINTELDDLKKASVVKGNELDSLKIEMTSLTTKLKTYEEEIAKNATKIQSLETEKPNNAAIERQLKELILTKQALEDEVAKATRSEIEVKKLQTLNTNLTTELETLKNNNNDDDGAENGKPQRDPHRSGTIVKEKTPNPNLKTFSNDPKEDVSDWLYMIEQHFNACFIEDSRKTLLISQYLRDTPESYYRTIDGAKLDWTQFKDAFTKRFQSPHYQDELRTRLASLTHTDSVYEYVNKFNSIMNRIKDMSETDRKNNFLIKLQSDYKAHVYLKHPNTLDEAMREAMDFELNHHPNRAKSAIKTYSASFKNNKKYKNNKFKNNYKTNNSKSEAYKLKPKSDITCNHCGKKGHIAINCYSLKKSRGEATSSNNSKSHKNYLAAVNTVDYTEAVISLMHVEVELNGKPAKALLDSGASVSLINAKQAKKLNISWASSTKHIQIANGSKVEILGVTDFLEVRIQESVSIMKFLVLNSAPFDVLLGLDWFASTGAQPDAANRKLSFPGWSIHLNDDEDRPGEEISTFNVSSSIEQEILDDSCWDYAKESGIKTDTEMAAFKKFAREYSDLVIKDYNELGCCNITKHKIITLESKPIFIPPYRKSFKERAELKEEVDRLLKANIIRHSKSAWSAPVILIPKPPGPNGIKEKRFCTDFRALNKITPQDHHPLPRIDDIFDNLAGSV